MQAKRFASCLVFQTSFELFSLFASGAVSVSIMKKVNDQEMHHVQTIKKCCITALSLSIALLTQQKAILAKTNFRARYNCLCRIIYPLWLWSSSSSSPSSSPSPSSLSSSSSSSELWVSLSKIALINNYNKSLKSRVSIQLWIVG